MIFHLSEPAKNLLLSLGWTEGRTVDIGDVVSTLRQRGYILHDVASGILQSLLGLYVENPGAFSVDFTNPSMVGRVFLRDQLVELSPVLFADLYPIATTVVASVFVSRSGFIFCVDDDRYSWHGYRSLERMLDVMLRIEQATPEERYVLLNE
jgi:hypothetical protein